jgi:hypothetical protein
MPVPTSHPKHLRPPVPPHGHTPRTTGLTKLPAGLRVQSQIKAGGGGGPCGLK